MTVDEDVLRSARNAFLVLMVVVVVVGAYQFATRGGISPAVAVIWLSGAGVYFVSKWHYGRTAGSDAAGGEGN